MNLTRFPRPSRRVVLAAAASLLATVQAIAALPTLLPTLLPALPTLPGPTAVRP